MNGALSAHDPQREPLQQEMALVEEAKKDASKFAALYKKYYAQIFLFVLKRVESEDTADDVTSQVFLKALTNLSKYKDMGFPFSSWLYRIARNEMYDLHRRSKINMVVSIEKKGIAEMISEMDDAAKQDHSSLRAALSKLADHEMELVELRFFEQRPFKEIGEILEITENNAKIRTYRVLDKLKTLLKNEG